MSKDMGKEEWVNRPTRQVFDEIVRQSGSAAVPGPQEPDIEKPRSTTHKGARMALVTATLAGALSGGCTKPENSPTPVRPTPDNPNPTATRVSTETPTVSPKPTEVFYPTFTPEPRKAPVPTVTPIIRGGGEIDPVSLTKILAKLDEAKKSAPSGLQSEVVPSVSAKDPKTGKIEYRYYAAAKYPSGFNLWYNILNEDNSLNGWQNSGLDIVSFPEKDLASFDSSYGNGILKGKDNNYYFNSIFPTNAGGEMLLTKINMLPPEVEATKGLLKSLDIGRLKINLLKQISDPNPVYIWDILKGAWTIEPPKAVQAEPGKEGFIGKEQVHSSITVEGYVQGVKVTSVWAIGESVYNRSYRPFDRWELNSAVVDAQYGPPGTAASRVSEIIMRTHYLGWREDAGLGFAKSIEELNAGYAEYLKNPKPYYANTFGKDGTDTLKSRKIDPLKLFRYVLSSELQAVQLDESHRGAVSIGFYVGDDGSLDIVFYEKPEQFYEVAPRDAAGLSVLSIFEPGFLVLGMPDKYQTPTFDAMFRYGEQGYFRKNELAFLRTNGIAQANQRPAILIKER